MSFILSFFDKFFSNFQYNFSGKSSGSTIVPIICAVIGLVLLSLAIYLVHRRYQQTQHIVQPTGTSISMTSLTQLRRRIRFKDNKETSIYEDYYDIIPNNSTSKVKIGNKDSVSSLFLSELPPIPKLTAQAEAKELQSPHSPSSMYDTWDVLSQVYENSMQEQSPTKETSGDNSVYINLKEKTSQQDFSKHQPDEHYEKPIERLISDSDYDIWWESHEDIYENDLSHDDSTGYANMDLSTEDTNYENVGLAGAEKMITLTKTTHENKYSVKRSH